MEMIRGRVLIAGEANGEVLRLTEPMSFWGGVDPATGVLTNPRGLAPGESVTGRILVLAATAGSSSSSAVMLELLANGRSPAALIMAQADAILVLGVIVAREMDWPTIPVLEIPIPEQAKLATGMQVRISTDGVVSRGLSCMDAPGVAREKLT